MELEPDPEPDEVKAIRVTELIRQLTPTEPDDFINGLGLGNEE